MKSLKRVFAVIMVVTMMVSCFAISASASKQSSYLALLLNNKQQTTGKTLTKRSINVLDALSVIDVVERSESGDFVTYTYNDILIYTIDKVNNIAYGNIDATEAQDFYYTFTANDITAINNSEFSDAKTTVYSNLTVIVYSSATYVIDVSEEYAKANNGEESTISILTTLKFEELLKVCRIEAAGVPLLGGYGVIEFTNENPGTQNAKAYVIDAKSKKKLFEVIIEELNTTLILQPGVTYEDNIYWEADDNLLADYEKDTYRGYTFKSITFIHGKVPYEIEEENQTATWTQGSKEGVSLTSKADIKFFDSVTVDDKTLVKDTDFTVTKGSTKVTFSPEYLKTLSVGKHTVVIKSIDGAATGTLTIKEAVTPTPEEKVTEPEAVADTADTNMIGVFAALTALSAAGYVTVKKKEN